MGALRQDRVALFEEHFLVCESCQDRLLEMEAYINAVRSVSPKLRAARKPAWPRMGWVGALAVAVAGVAMIVRTPGRVGEVAIVQLEASRGIEGRFLAKAIAGQALSFQIDLTQIPAASSYRLEIV